MSPAAAIACVIHCATNPSIAPATKLSKIPKNNEEFVGAADGFIVIVITTVKIKINDSFTMPAISFLLKTGANRINPARRAKMKIPAPMALLISGKYLGNSCKIASII